MSEQEMISGERIVRLYKNGLSQNDISRIHNISVKHIRAILKKAGFDTASYRRIPAEYEKVIDILLLGGVTFRSAGEVTDISFHVIRDIAERLPEDSVREAYHKPKFEITEREETFLCRFNQGECFCKLSVCMGLSKKEILRCYSMIDNSVLTKHRKALRRHLKAEDLTSNTVTSLARKYGISASVVKAHLNS